MFAVIFEVQSRSDRWETYLGLAGALRPELVAIDGFIDNVRYGSKRREGWVQARAAPTCFAITTFVSAR